MSATLFALVLFGCSDDATSCQRISMPAATYSTEAACTARLDGAVMSEPAQKAEFPSVFAQCLTTQKLASLGKTVDLNRVAAPQFAAAN